MTQYFYAPKASQENLSPPELVETWRTAPTNVTATVLLDTGSVPYVQLTGASADTIDNYLLRLVDDSSGNAIPDLADFEAYYEFEYNTLANTRNGDFRLTARANSSKTGYVIGPREDTGLEALYINAGARSTIDAPAAFGVTPAAGTRYSVRSRLSGSTLETKMWETGSTEPAYELTVTDTAISTAGFTGIYSIFPDRLDTRLYKFSIGTNGDPAPTTGVTVPALTTTLVADENDTPLPAAVNVNVTVQTLTWALVGIGTQSVGTDGAISTTDADLTLESGQSIASGTEYWVNYQEASGTRQRTVKLMAA